MPIKPKSHAQRMKALAPKKPEDRPSSCKRGYGRPWRALRQYHLNRFPLCQAPGCTEAATDVDHIVARARGGTDDDTNLQSLCHSHHSQKTAREDGSFGRKANQ